MRHIVSVMIIGLLFLSMTGALAEEKLAAPTQLPRINSSMLSSGFWISRHEYPDQVIMTTEQIAAFNNHIQNDLKLTNNIFATVSEERTQRLLTTLEQTITDFTDKGYYTKEGVRNDKDFIEKNKQNMHLTAVVSGVGPRFGLITRLTDQRFFPTPDGLYEKQGDVDFDQLQNSALDVGTAVAIVHTSRDRLWAYVYGPISEGWVRLSDIAIGNQEQVTAYDSSSQFIVVTAAFADVYADKEQTRLLNTLRMGVKLPVVAIEDNIAIVRIPQRDTQGKLQIVNGYVDAASVYEGYLKMTARTVYTQAFRWLNTPYGWGDFRGFIDCSRFIQSVYATMGVKLPRDSKNQALVGMRVADFDDATTVSQKNDALSDAPTGSLLVLKGHIMLYLGNVNDVPYVIHASSGYRQQNGEQDMMRSLMRVVVTDLSLGDGSRKGSLLKRLYRIVSIENADNH